MSLSRTTSSRYPAGIAIASHGPIGLDDHRVEPTLRSVPRLVGAGVGGASPAVASHSRSCNCNMSSGSVRPARHRSVPIAATAMQRPHLEARHGTRLLLADISGSTSGRGRAGCRRRRRICTSLVRDVVVYTIDMDVAVTEFGLTSAAGSTQRGEGNDVVITDPGTPVARIVAIDATAATPFSTDSRGHHQPSDQRLTRPGGRRQAPTRTETPGRRNRQ